MGNNKSKGDSERNRKIVATQPEGRDLPFQNQQLVMNNYETAVFVSYAWGNASERIVGKLEKAFAERGIRVVRDKKELGYKGSIEAFERRIGQGQCVVLVIGDKYLRSEHCMYELVEVDKHRNLRDRIFPIVLAEAKIYKPIDRLNYIKHWDEKIEQLNQAIKEVKVMSNLSGITADLDKYASIRSSFDYLTDFLSDMNTLTLKSHTASGFSTLINAVEYAMIRKPSTFQSVEVTPLPEKILDNGAKKVQNKTIKPELAQVTIIIEKDIHKFTDKEKDAFVFVVSKLTGVSLNQIRVLQVAEGSVIITLEMPEIGAEQLMGLFLDGNSELLKLQIKNVKVAKPTNAVKHNSLEPVLADNKTISIQSGNATRPDKISINNNEEIRKLRAENEILRMELQKQLEEETKINELAKKSQQAWVKKQISTNMMDLTLDELRAHYERGLGIGDE